MKRKMEAGGAPARPESRLRIKDPGNAAASAKVKKTEPDVFPVRKVPAKGRPTKGGNSRNEKLVNKRI